MGRKNHDTNPTAPPKRQPKTLSDNPHAHHHTAHTTHAHACIFRLSVLPDGMVFFNILYHAVHFIYQKTFGGTYITVTGHVLHLPQVVEL